MPLFPRNNNLEWLRLIFAIQVLVEHAAIHMGVILPEFIKHFPGVPAFFFVSGFLIYASYCNASGVRYFQNRFLRLFPGLVFVTFGGLLVLVMASGWTVLHEYAVELLIWFVAQTTIGQAYNPSQFRNIGVGVINGSLWTITCEILFYICVPFIVRFERKFRFAVIFMTAVSFIIFVLSPHFFNRPVYRDKSIYDIMALTPLVWGWMFGVGIIVVKNFASIKKRLKWLVLAIIPLCVIINLSSNGFLLGSVGNRLGLIYFLCYISMITWIAFSLHYVRLPFDFSFGIYIWHMPVINAVLYLKFESVTLVLLITVFFSAISWYFVERPMLRRKQISLKPI
jgi:peptidoglycan/LPS O-acetylase OafA/YrhL